MKAKMPSWIGSAILVLLFKSLMMMISTVNSATIPDPNSQMDSEMAKFSKLRLPPERFNDLKQMHENLYYGALKALLGQLGRGLYRDVAEGEQRRLARCLDRIDNRFDLSSAARCLVESRERHLEVEALRKEGGVHLKSAFAQEEAKWPKMHFWARQRDFVRRSAKIRVFDKQWKLPKLGMGSRRLLMLGKKCKRPLKLSRILGLKKRTRTRLDKYGSDKRRRRARRELHDGLDIEDMRKIRQQFEALDSGQQKKEDFQIHSTQEVTPLHTKSEKSLASRISNLLLKAAGPRAHAANLRWGKAQKTLERLAEKTEQSKHFPGTKVFEKRMYDIVLDRDEPSLGPSERRSPLGLLQAGIKLLEMVPTRANASTAQSHNVRMFSPRFMPLAPDKGGPAHPNSMLSPTLLAMYEEKDNRSVANVPEMLRKAGVSEQDRQGIIATFMELTGTTTHVEKALGLLEKVDFFKEGVGQPLMKATSKLLNAFFSLEDSLDAHQRRECRQRGFTFAHTGQLQQLLRDQAVDGKQLPAEALADFERLAGMSAAEKEEALWATVQQIAGTRPRRFKRTFPTSVFKPFILAPFQFAPMFGLSVFGPVILSPSTFSPYILSPSVFSPLILSPLVFSPLVLSPSVASPWIVTPGVANPYIISPYVFGPFILGPLVLHPFILSPYIISPNILNPYVLSPIVLNPIALAPDILSPQVLGGAVLSPAMLSPAILTQTYLMVSIFSPTFLS